MFMSNDRSDLDIQLACPCCACILYDYDTKIDGSHINYRKPHWPTENSCL